MKKQLLPSGFYDLLFDEARKNHDNTNIILDEFFSKNYQLIKTPLVEFSNCQNSKNSFKLVDVDSAKNLSLRNDITLQISRLIKTRLSEENLPLKLCYAGDVLCLQSEDLYADRQQTQLGLEIIGSKDKKDDFEVIETLLSSLEKLQLKDLLIEISIPEFLEIFLAEIGFEKDQELIAAIKQKNISKVKKLIKDKSKIISEIILQNNDLEKLISNIKKEINSDKINQELQKAQEISNFLNKKFPNIKICFDLFGDRDSTYHNQIVFDVFCDKFSYPIAKGGRYKIDDLDAVGATIYMNYLRKLK